MRINVCSQELTKEVALVNKADERGNVYFGVRIFFDSSPRLHQTADDDDRSAITYWLPNDGSFKPQDLADVFGKAATLIYDKYMP